MPHKDHHKLSNIPASGYQLNQQELLSNGQDRLGFKKHLNVNSWYMMLFFDLQLNTAPMVLSDMLYTLEQLPLVKIPLNAADTHTRQYIRYKPDITPQNALQQSFCLVPSQIDFPELHLMSWIQPPQAQLAQLTTGTPTLLLHPSGTLAKQHEPSGTRERAQAHITHMLTPPLQDTRNSALATTSIVPPYAPFSSDPTDTAKTSTAPQNLSSLERPFITSPVDAPTTLALDLDPTYSCNTGKLIPASPGSPPCPQAQLIIQTKFTIHSQFQMPPQALQPPQGMNLSATLGVFKTRHNTDKDKLISKAPSQIQHLHQNPHQSLRQSSEGDSYSLKDALNDLMGSLKPSTKSPGAASTTCSLSSSQVDFYMQDESKLPAASHLDLASALARPQFFLKEQAQSSQPTPLPQPAQAQQLEQSQPDQSQLPPQWQPSQQTSPTDQSYSFSQLPLLDALTPEQKLSVISPPPSNLNQEDTSVSSTLPFAILQNTQAQTTSKVQTTLCPADLLPATLNEACGKMELPTQSTDLSLPGTNGSHILTSVEPGLSFGISRHQLLCQDAETLRLIKEAELLQVLHGFYPHHRIYQQYSMPVVQPAEFDDRFTQLNFSEIVSSYHKLLDGYRPTLVYYLPNVDEYSHNTAEHCLIVQRNPFGKMQGVLWLEVLPNFLNIRLIFKFNYGRVLEPLLNKALAYAYRRGKSRVLIYCDIKHQDTIGLRYRKFGFTPTSQYIHAFSF